MVSAWASFLLLAHVHAPKFDPNVKMSLDEMIKEKIPLESRDCCAEYFLSLRNCKKETFYLPWKCEEEKLIYKNCVLRE